MNSSGWRRFRKQQAAEREQLRRLLAGLRPVLAKCGATAPSEIELAALATMLHAFYTGIENLFKRVAVELDSQPVRGEAWHRDLLRAMTRTGRTAADRVWHKQLGPPWVRLLPIMNSRTLITLGQGIILLMAGGIGGIAAQADRGISGRVTRAGIFTLTGVERRVAALESVTGYVSESGRTFQSAATNIPMLRGTSFGFDFLLEGVPTNRPMRLRHDIQHPPMVRPDGRTVTRQSSECEVTSRDGKLEGKLWYTLREDFELVAGTWTLAVAHKGTVLVRKQFTVLPVRPRAEPPQMPEGWTAGWAVIQAIRHGKVAWLGPDCIWAEGQPGQRFYEGAALRTDSTGVCDLFLKNNGPVLQLAPGTRLVFDKLRWKRADSNYVIETVMTLKASRIVGISRALAPGSRYQVDLPEAAGSVSVQKGKFSVSADSKVEVAHGLVEVAFKGTKRTVEEGFAFDPASQATRVLTAREQRELQECFGLVIPRCPPPEHRPPWPLLRSIPRGF